MLDYIYIILLVSTLSYSIYRDIYIYRKEDHKSYPFKEGKENTFFHFFTIMIILGSFFFTKNDKFNIFKIIFFVFGTIKAIETIIYNYLIYKKTNDKKLVFNTIMYLLMVTILFIAILK